MMRITPADAHAASVSTDKHHLAPAAPVHDTLRHGPSSLAAQHNNRHPLEHRLQNWDKQQADLRLETMRRVYGMSEPVRRGMELHIVQQGARPNLMGTPVGLDILNNTDCKLDVDDVFRSMPSDLSLHDDMDRKMRFRQ